MVNLAIQLGGQCLYTTTHAQSLQARSMQWNHLQHTKSLYRIESVLLAKLQEKEALLVLHGVRTYLF